MAKFLALAATAVGNVTFALAATQYWTGISRGDIYRGGQKNQFT